MSLLIAALPQLLYNAVLTSAVEPTGGSERKSSPGHFLALVAADPGHPWTSLFRLCLCRHLASPLCASDIPLLPLIRTFTSGYRAHPVTPQ